MYCLPGSRVQDVLELLQYIVKEEDEQPEFVVYISTNDTGGKMDEIKRNKYRELGNVRIRISRLVISGLLPVLKGGEKGEYNR